MGRKRKVINEKDIERKSLLATKHAEINVSPAKVFKKTNQSLTKLAADKQTFFAQKEIERREKENVCARERERERERECVYVEREKEKEYVKVERESEVKECVSQSVCESVDVSERVCARKCVCE